jgi:hypothetical protein
LLLLLRRISHLPKTPETETKQRVEPRDGCKRASGACSSAIGSLVVVFGAEPHPSQASQNENRLSRTTETDEPAYAASERSVLAGSHATTGFRSFATAFACSCPWTSITLTPNVVRTNVHPRISLLSLSRVESRFCLFRAWNAQAQLGCHTVCPSACVQVDQETRSLWRVSCFLSVFLFFFLRKKQEE